MEKGLFMGLDSSTQSLKVTVVDAELRIHAFDYVNFDSELPQYKTKDGVHRDASGNGTVTGPVLMWVEALELLFDKLQRSSFPFDKVRAISGSGQQHGSVYWADGAGESYLKKLNSSSTLRDQLQNAFSRKDSPVWMDSSTTLQCREIEEAIGGALNVSQLTGSRAYERFTGPQIRKIFQTEKKTYQNTERISLVSSFMASLLIGDYASIDHSDGAGMNLMDLKLRSWSTAALQATAPGLEEKLGPLAPPHGVAGKLDKFFVERYQFKEDCLVINWSGDNPCSLAGLALDKPGDLAISLGTSDTVFGVTRDPKPGMEGHVFPNPVDPHSYMAMLCYKNGSLTRQEIRDKCAKGSWDIFNSLLNNTPPLNDGNLGFYYKEPEILPPLPVGVHRFVIRGSDGTAEEISAFENATEVRAIIEGQFVAMRAHAERIGMPTIPERVIATGGASTNKGFLKALADIFGSSVYTAQRPDSASLGAALRAAHAWTCSQQKQKFLSFTTFLESAAKDSAVLFTMVATPGDKDLHLQYGFLAAKRVEIENKLLQEQGSNVAYAQEN